MKARPFSTRLALFSGCLFILLAAPTVSIIRRAWLETASTLTVSGLMATISALVVVTGFFLALVTHLAASRQPSGISRAWPALFVLGSLASLSFGGVRVLHNDKFLTAPTETLALVFVPAALAAVSYFLRGKAGQDAIAAGLARVGLLALVTGVLAYPVAAGSQMASNRVKAKCDLGVGPPLSDPPERIILITLDALRASSIEPLPNRQLPGFEALRGFSTTFGSGVAASDRTLVSLAAILTGQSPADVFPSLRNPAGLIQPGEVTSMASLLRRAGYRTHAWTSLITSQALGLQQDFDATHVAGDTFFDSTFTSSENSLVMLWQYSTRHLVKSPLKHNEPLGSTREVVDLASKKLERDTGRVFAWIHLGTPHAPFAECPEDELGRSPGRCHYVDMDWKRRHASAQELAKYRDLYERNVAYSDTAILDLLAALRRSPDWERTLLVVTGDHGESFDSGCFGHAKGCLPESVARVPLYVHSPGQTEWAEKPGPAAHVDILPTVLGQVFEKSHRYFEGVDLIGSAVPPDRHLQTWGLYGKYFHGKGNEDWEDWSTASYWRIYKLVSDHRTGSRTLFDLSRSESVRVDAPRILQAMEADTRDP